MTYPHQPVKHVEVGGNVEPMWPTSHLKFKAGRLYQWFEAKRQTEDATFTRGEWVLVPSED